MPITPEQLNEFKSQLLDEKQRIETQLGAIARKIGDGDDYAAELDATIEHSADPQDNADQIEEFESRIATLNSLEPRLNDINNALDKIENNPDQFGLDENSNEPIVFGRLQANPAARTNI